jgi:flagellar hook-associated protein 2
MSSTSSSSSSGSVGNLQTSNLLRLTGTNLMSGLDTDSIIKALTSRTQSKIDSQKQLEQIAEWKRDMYRDVTTSLKTFSSTYFSYLNSNTNILSSSFFNTTSITSSSSAVSATGSAVNAKNMKINSISQLASAATYNSSQKVSTEAITSGKIYDNWEKSRVGGQSVVVTYGGTDYTLSLSSSVILDSHNTDGSGNLATSEIQKITDGLNDQINSSTDLKGKLAFSYDTTSGKISLKATDPTKSVGIKPFREDENDVTGPKFFTELGYANPVAGVGSVTAYTALNRSVTDNSATSLFSHTVPSTSQLSFSYGSENFTLNLGANIDITGVTDQATVLKSITDQLNNQINSTNDASPYKDIKGKINFSVTGTGSSARITVQNTGTEDFTLTGGTENLQKGLGTLATVGASQTQSFASANLNELTTTYLGDALQGSTLTFDLSGLKKTITFGVDESQYADLTHDPDTNGVNATGLQKLQSYLQQQIDSNFGTNSDGTKKITVDLDSTSGQLSFKTTDSASILTLTSSDGLNVLNQNGALRILSGETNRIETGKTLQDLATDSGGSGEFSKMLQAGSDGTYKITVNGQVFSFSGTDTVGDVMTKINDNAAAGVTISYSQTTDTFRIISSETGSQGKTDFADAAGGGNLAQVLFGLGTSNLTDALTGNVTTDSTGKITDASGSSYTFSMGGNTQTVSIAAGTSFNSISDLAAAVQTQLNASGSTLQNKITVGATGNHLTFTTADGSTLAVSHDSGSAGDVLNVGSGISTLDSSQSLSALAAVSNGRITVNGSNYYVSGSNVAYSGSTLLSTVLSSMNGQDLKMSVCLNGSTTATDITRSSNSFTLDGVTITANKQTASTDPPITFSSSSSTDDLYKKITDFVTAYNAILAKVNTYTSDTPERDSDHKLKYQPLTDDQKKDMSSDEIDKWNTQAKKGLLQNDNTLNSILSDLNATMNATETSSGLSLSQIGISTKSYDYTSGGQLGIDETTLKSMLSTDPDRVQELFTNATDGISVKLSNVLDKYVGTFGGNGALINLAGTDTTINDQSEMSTEINQYGKNISDLKDQLQTEQDHWWSKFSSMEQSLSVLNSQMGYLSQMSGSSSS